MKACEARKLAEDFKSEQKKNQYNRFIRRIEKEASRGENAISSMEMLTEDTIAKLKNDGYQLKNIAGSFYNIIW